MKKLLAQGEVSDACARAGEEAKHMSPKQPLIYKFLGKCYMRRRPRAAGENDNYRKYLRGSPPTPRTLRSSKSMTK